MYGSRGTAAAQKVEKSFLRTRPLLILCIAALALAALPSAAAERPEEDDGGSSQGAERSFLEALTSKLLRKSDVQPRHLGHGPLNTPPDKEGAPPDNEDAFSETDPHNEAEPPADAPGDPGAGHPGTAEQAGAGPEADPAADASGEAGTQGIGKETIAIGKEMGDQAKHAQTAKVGLDNARKDQTGGIPPWKRSFEELNAKADELRQKAEKSLVTMKGGVQAIAQHKKKTQTSVNTVEDHYNKEKERTEKGEYEYKNIIKDQKGIGYDTPVDQLGLGDTEAKVAAAAPDTPASNEGPDALDTGGRLARADGVKSTGDMEGPS